MPLFVWGCVLFDLKHFQYNTGGRSDSWTEYSRKSQCYLPLLRQSRTWVQALDTCLRALCVPSLGRNQSCRCQQSGLQESCTDSNIRVFWKRLLIWNYKVIWKLLSSSVVVGGGTAQFVKLLLLRRLPNASSSRHNSSFPIQSVL